MSRSFKKHAITGVTTARSEKYDKTLDHKRKRVELRESVAKEDWEKAEVDKKRLHEYFSKDGYVDWTGDPYAEIARRK